MPNKTFHTRYQIKRDSSTNWEKAVNFVPLSGEQIYYTDLNRIKVGDGVTNVNNLPFNDAALADRVTTVEGKVTTLIGDDASKSARTIASEEVAKTVTGLNLNYYYFDDLESMVTAINNNTFPEDNKEQLSTSVVQITTGFDALIIDILADVTTESDLSISKSCTINLNGHTVTVNNDGRLKFINSASPTEVIINATGATIQRAGTQSAAKNLITFMGYSLTINGGQFNEYNSRDNAATVCSPLAVNNVTAKIYVHGARFEAAGRYRGSGTYLYKFSSFEATNSTFVGGALQASASAYSADQTMGIGFDCRNIDSSSATSIVKLNNCVCSGEVMAADFACKLEAVGTTFESCDHGLFVTNFANLQSCTFVHKSWANLIASQLQYPFKVGETKVKTQYSETHAEYANLGFCYIGSSVYNASAIMNNCLEQIDSEKETENAHIVLSTNYNYKAPSLYLSNHTALYSIRVDPDRGKGAAKLYVGENVTIPSFGDTVGDVDESSYAGIGFYSGFNVHEGLHNGITQVDKKLDKVSTTSTSNRLYGLSTSGEQKVFNISYTPAAESVPLYSGNGNLRTSSPTENTHCANKQYVDAQVQSANYKVPVVDSPPTTHLPTEQGQMYMEERTNKFYIAVDDGGFILWKGVQFSDSGSSGQSITYTLSISGNVITLTGSDGSTSPITLPVYNGGVS